MAKHKQEEGPTPQQHQLSTPKRADSAQAPSSLPSAFDLITPCWEAIRLNITTYLCLIIFPILALVFYEVMLSKSAVSGIPHSTSVMEALLGFLVLIIVLIITEPMFIYTTAKSAQEQKIDLEEAISGGFRFFFRLIGLGAVVCVYILGGLILLIVPGVFMAKRYLLSPYIMISNDLSIGETLNQSKVISKEYSNAIWGILGVTLLIALIGVIPLIGQIISGILGLIYNVAPAIRYEQIKKLGLPTAHGSTATSSPAN